MVSRRREFALATSIAVVATAGALAAGEGLLRLALNPGDFLYATVVADPILGHRIPPQSAGHDAMGFRNTALQQSADIIAIGDSMTYGVSASREGSWPYQLGVALRRPVYNMGLGGYGPLQYLHLMRETVPHFSPRLVVVGFYTGNDVLDAYDMPQDLPHWSSWRLSTRPPGRMSASQIALAAEPTRFLGGFRDWLARNSMLYGVVRATVLSRIAGRERAAQAARVSPEVWMAWSDPARPAVKTIFAPATWLANMDPGSEIGRDGVAIAKRVLTEIKSEAEKRGARLLIAIIPTKERVYCPYMKATGAQLPASFERLCAVEAALIADFSAFLGSAGIAYIDTSPALQEYAASHVPIYQQDNDSHPVAAGYGVIAAEVARAARPMLAKP